MQALREFLRHLRKDEEKRIWWKKSGNIFIFAEVWGARRCLLDDFGDILRGSLSLKYNTGFTVSQSFY